MSYASFQLAEGADRRWTLTGQYGDDTPDDTVGVYATAAEAFAVSGGTLVRPVPAGQIGANIIPLTTGGISLAFDPLAPFDWESLPPQPLGLSFAEMPPSEMVRVMRGAFTGLRLKSFVEIEGGYTADGDTYTYTGTGETDTEVHPSGRQAAAHRNPQKSLPLIVDPLSGGVSLPYQPVVVLGFGDTGTDASTVVSQGTFTVTHTGGGTPTVTGFSGGPGSSVRIAFYRGANDKTCRMLLAVRAGGSGDIWAYVPVGGVDFHDFYGIPSAPPSIPGSGVTYREITGDGPTVLGVQSLLYGWQTTTTYTSGGSYTVTPSLDVEEL